MTSPKNHENFIPPSAPVCMGPKKKTSPIWDVTFSFTTPPSPPYGAICENN